MQISNSDDCLLRFCFFINNFVFFLIHCKRFSHFILFLNSLIGIVESLLEIRPDMNVTMANQGLFAWLLRRLQKRPVFDKNKLYVSELLSILLQMDEANRRQLGEVDGIDILLQQLSVYKRHDPGSQEEIELMLNLFDCLCSSLMLPENKDRFLKGEGIQLMNLMLR